MIDFATAPGCTFLHRWQPGDVIMWDNRAVLHRGRSWPDDKPRHMVRTTISATDADGLAEMWPAMVRVLNGDAVVRSNARR